MLLGLGSCPGTPWGPSWDGDPKNHKKSLFEILLLEHICDRCWHFCGHVFYMFPKPLYFHLFAPVGAPRSRFCRSVATNYVTIWSIMEKCKLCSREARASKYSFLGYVIQLGLPFLCTYVDSWLAACICFTILWDLALLCLHLGSICQHICNDVDLQFQWRFLIKIFKSKRNPVEGICDTS